MKKYSEFFNTLYDEDSSGSGLSSGTHYSILRALVFVPLMKFHDFAVIWGEGHDQRIIWIIEQLYARLLLHNVLFIGERAGQVTVLTSEIVSVGFEAKLQEICGKIPAYCSSVSVGKLLSGCGDIIDDSRDQVEWYLNGIVALWSLGTREAVLSPHENPDPEWDNRQLEQTNKRRSNG